MERKLSPDGVLEVVVLRSNAGATTSYGYHVCLTKPEEKPNPKEAFFRGDQLSNFTIDWRGPRNLEISFDKGRVFHFSNFWQGLEDPNDIVEIQLIQQKIEQ
jgi:hypothetical protein